MILVGELEYTDKKMAPDGFRGFLFVGNNGNAYQYNISPYPEKESAWVGDNFVSGKNLSVTEFLQSIVDQDIEIGRNAYVRFKDNVGIRLKGMSEWITRK